MTDIGIATAAEQPINRHGALAGETMQEGDLVGLNAEGDMVQATATNGVMALGACLTPATELEAYGEDEVKLVVEANRALVGRDRVSAISNGVEVENGDGDWEFAPGQPVYMGESGEYTQDAPVSEGALVQIVGTALTPDRIRLDVRASDVTA